MIRTGTMAVVMVGLLGLAGCNQHTGGYGYGGGYRPTSGGPYNRSYVRPQDQRDQRGRDTRNQQDRRGNPPASNRRDGGDQGGFGSGFGLRPVPPGQSGN